MKVKTKSIAEILKERERFLDKYRTDDGDSLSKATSDLLVQCISMGFDHAIMYIAGVENEKNENK